MAPVPTSSLSAQEAGDLDTAVARLQRHLHDHPDDLDALLQLASLLCRRGDLAGAVAPLEQILKLAPEHRLALTRLGAVLQNLGQLEQALTLLERAVSTHPDHAEAWCNLAIVHLGRRRRGHLTRAREALERALVLEPDHALALRALARTLRQQGEPEAALPPLGRLLALEPSHWPELLEVGDALLLARRLPEAEAAYRAALTASGGLGHPRAPGAPGDGPSPLAALHANLGVVLLQRGACEEARDCFSRALALWPSHPETLANLALALHRLDQPQEALEASQQALGLRPDLAAGHASRGLALWALGRREQGLASLREAVRLAPERDDYVGDLALLLLDLNHREEVLQVFERALQERPASAELRTTQALFQLQLSGLRQGWDAYEARLEGPQATVELPLQGPRWRGEELGDFPLLLVGEQGLGDMLQFLRYAPLLRRRAGRLHLCLPEQLRELAECAGLADAVLTAEQARDHPGPWLPLLSPFPLLAPDPLQLRTPMPYMNIPAGRIDHWRPRINTAPQPLVALHWQGNPETERSSGRGRSIPLEMLAPLAGQLPVRLVSLQRGAGAEQRHHCSFPSAFVADQERIDAVWDFLDIGAILHSCDLLITSDSAVAHLAGALGLPVWLLLKRLPDWRWGLEGDSTPWYPTMRLFRQRRSGDWPEVIERVTLALRQTLALPPS